MDTILTIVTRRAVEAISASLESGKRRGFVPLRGLEEEELQAVARTLRGLGLKAGVPQNGGGIWWALRPTKQKK